MLLPPSPIPAQAAPLLLAPAPPNAQATQSFNHAALTTITPPPHPQALPAAYSPMDSHPNPPLQAPPRSSPPMTKKQLAIHHSPRRWLLPSLTRRKRKQRTRHRPANTTSSREKEAASTSTGATATCIPPARAMDARRSLATAGSLERAR